MKAWHKFLIVLLVLGCSINGEAQLTPRNLFKPFTEAVIRKALPAAGRWNPFPVTAAGWRQVLPDSVIHRYVIDGTQAAKQPFPVLPVTDFLEFTRTKNRANYEQKWTARRVQLISLVMAESMQGEGRFNDRIAEAVWAICEESFWGIPAHIPGLPDVDAPYVDLFAAETASLLAWTSYFAGKNLDQVSARIKPRILSEVNRRIFHPMLTASWWWIGNSNPNGKLNNWSPWIMSNYITAALLLETDEAKRAAAIKRGLNTIDHYLNGLGDDGAIDEGPIYWFPSVGCVFDVLALLDNATSGKLQLYSNPFLKGAASYIYKTHIAGKYYVNMGDATATMNADGIFLYRIGNRIMDPVLMQLGAETARQASAGADDLGDRMFSRKLFNLMERTACLKYECKNTGAGDAWMPGIEMMCARSENGVFVAAHGGHNGESHNHNDVGDFMVYVNGQPLLVDVGRGTYTGRTFSAERYTLWFNNSGYHNLPEINGMQQKDGSRYAATAVQYHKDRKASVLTMDIAKAYPAAAGVQYWKRTVSLYREGIVKISDGYALNPPGSVSQHLITVCDADIRQPGKIIFKMPDDTKVELLYSASMWEATIQPVLLSQPEDEEIRQVWKGQTIRRITLNARHALLKGTTTLLLRKINE
ncbi:heparinase II/III domain-containing protein [Niabella hirudinis]|uniref:heparinase II/III domain-containing protein n=1 Tax=Niabella hirudinis TaxID=1285929 RepID=UPI003EBCE535